MLCVAAQPRLTLWEPTPDSTRVQTPRPSSLRLRSSVRAPQGCRVPPGAPATPGVKHRSLLNGSSGSRGPRRQSLKSAPCGSAQDRGSQVGPSRMPRGGQPRAGGVTAGPSCLHPGWPATSAPTARRLVRRMNQQKNPSENVAVSRPLRSTYRLGRVVPGARGDRGALASRRSPGGRRTPRGNPVLL